MPGALRSSLPTRRSGRRGFSLVELLVAILILSLIMAALVELFTSSSRIARVQTEVAEVQQSLRVAQEEITRMVRMAGAGGLPVRWLDRDPESRISPFTYAIEGAFPNGFALEIQSNVPTDTRMPQTGTDANRAWVMPNSDVLIVRGSLTTPAYYLLDSVPVSANMVVEIPDTVGDRLWPTGPLVARVDEAILANRPLSFIGRDLLNPDNYVVMELNPATTNTVPAACTVAVANVPGSQCISIGLTHNPAGNVEVALANGLMTLGNKLGNYSGVPTFNLPSGAPVATAPVPRDIGSLAMLDEFRYFVRAEWQVPNDPTSRLTPVLSRAEFVPGTDILIDQIDLVENILSFQVVAALDANRDSEILDTGDDQDELLFNDAGDLATGVNSPGATATRWWERMPLAYLRMTLVAQARRPDHRYEAPLLGDLEDADLAGTITIDGETYSLNDDLRFRRRARQWTVDPKDLQ
ncbi:MAG: prepilin-type N-terminal cleavage/methylation domain-containing protein [Acidobacteriota bacterium]